MCEEEEMHKGTKRHSQCGTIIYENHYPKYKEFVIFLLFVAVICFLRQGSLCNPGWPGTNSI